MPGDAQPNGAFRFFQELQDYLKTDIEFIHPEGDSSSPPVRIKVTATNTAPEEPEYPKVVFMGVGLSVANPVGDLMPRRNPPRPVVRGKVEKNDDTSEPAPWVNDENRKSTSAIRYRRTHGPEYPMLTQDEQQHGEVLFPGEWVAFELDVQPKELAALHIRVDATLSRRHLFHSERPLPVPEQYTRPPAVAALKDFNAVDLHGILETVIPLMPNFADDVRLSDVQKLAEALPPAIAREATIRQTLSEVFRKHELPWLRGHIRASFIYLDDVKKRLTAMKEAMATNDVLKMTAAASDLRALEKESQQLNHETEQLMATFGISDEEAGFKYRGR